MSTFPYIFIERDSGSSVYTAVRKYLIDHRKKSWKKINPQSSRFYLMLGDRNRLPWHMFGQVRGLHQLVNYYRGSDKILCRKASLVRTLKDYCKKNGLQLFDWMPTSFIICPLSNDTEICENRFIQMGIQCRRPDEREEMNVFDARCPHEVWIAKESSGSKGDGIEISKDVDKLLEMVDNQSKSYVIQQYIQNPLLLDGRRKFDIRCWVLLDSEYKIYLFREGVLRTSSEQYDPDNLNKTTCHLTNHSLQRDQSEHYGKYENGNEMFYEEFNSYLLSTYGVSLETSLLPQIRNIIKTCLVTVYIRLNTDGLAYSCFQLFGFDFLVDEDLKIWLLEINGAPACAEKLLPSLVSSLVQTAIDPVFTPQRCPDDEDNLFDLI